ncbi:hypothetical protein WJX73_006334 [Symbiochloris irregularis]|uniref:Uncharacterized protein n=1 Tax=Symbiochloris irregularis TaxID=706552 RepID=A0AAW1PZI4_9CHLO
MSASGVDKAVEKLRQCLAADQAYEGQQIALTTHSRLRSRKRLVESYQLLEQAAVLQLQQGQVTCGAELAGLLVQDFKKDKVIADDQSLLRLAFTGILENSKRSLPDTPLVHFLILLQQALAEASLPLVQLLKEEYASALAVDESLPMLFEQIMSRHFQIAPRGNMGGMMASMLEMLNGFGQADE